MLEGPPLQVAPPTSPQSKTISTLSSWITLNELICPVLTRTHTTLGFLLQANIRAEISPSIIGGTVNVLWIYIILFQFAVLNQIWSQRCLTEVMEWFLDMIQWSLRGTYRTLSEKGIMQAYSCWALNDTWSYSQPKAPKYNS